MIDSLYDVDANSTDEDLADALDLLCSGGYELSGAERDRAGALMALYEAVGHLGDGERRAARALVQGHVGSGNGERGARNAGGAHAESRRARRAVGMCGVGEDFFCV